MALILRFRHSAFVSRFCLSALLILGVHLGIMAPARANEQCQLLFPTERRTNLDEQFQTAFTHDVVQFGKKYRNDSQSISRIEAIAWYKQRLQEFMNSAQNLHDFSKFLRAIEKTGFVSDQYLDAWRQVDFLAAIRSKKPEDFTKDDIETLNQTLEDLFETSHLPWTPILEGFNVWENPNYAKLVLNGWIEAKLFLMDDYLNHGAQLNMTLVTSLANVPAPTQNELLSTIGQSLLVVDSQYRSQNLDPGEQNLIKAPSREWQFVQQILIRNQVFAALSKLPPTVEARDLREVQFAIQRLNRHETSYTFETVFAVAKAIQTHFTPLLSGDDFVDVFGSFPNLTANLKTSDVDMIFSPRIDQVYYDLVSQTPSIEPVSSATFFANEAVLLSDSVIAAEGAVRQILNSVQEPGELFSVNSMTRTVANGRPEISETLAQTETWYGMASPIMIRIFSNRIILRFWDGLTGTREIPASVLEFSMKF